jgi:tol-pal system protein YbgF
MKKTAIMVSALGMLLIALNVHAGATEDRVAAVEKRITTIEQTNINKGSEIATALQQIEGFRTEFGSIKGAMDANTQMLASLNTQMQTRYQELESRIQRLEDQLKLIQDMLKKGGGLATGATATEEYLTYQVAADKMSASDYLGAAASFQEFIQRFPKSQLAGDAQFNTAECFFQAKDYQQSIKQYQVFIERNSRSAKVANAMVRQGAGFAELGMKDEAKAFFAKVMQDFPNSGAAEQAKAKIDRLEGRATMTAEAHQGAAPNVEFDYPKETIWQLKEKQKAAQQPAPPAVQAPKPAPVQQAVTPQAAPQAPKRPREEF